MFTKPPMHSFFAKRNHKDMYKRTIGTLPDLIGTYHPLSKKHLAPIYGAVGVKSHAIKHFYEAIYQNKKGGTATEKLTLCLFNQLGTEFRATQSKGSAAYSLNSCMLAKLLSYLDSENVNDKELTFILENEWNTHHHEITGSKLPKEKLNNLIEYIVESKIECNTKKMYPYRYTEFILLTFLFLKCKTRKELLDYVQVISMNESLQTLLLVDTKNYIPTPNELFKNISSYEVGNQLYNLNSVSGLINNDYEICLLSLLQSTNLYKVSLSQYGYKRKRPVSNCTEVCFHNFCNILLHNSETCSFDLSLLASTLTPHAALKAIYQMQEFKTDMLDSPVIGQAFMNLFSGNPNFIYAKEDYELKATIENFIPVINFLFGINANCISDLDKFFSNEKRTFRFIENNNSINIHMDLPIQNKSYQMIFTFTPRHCSFESSYLANNETSVREIDHVFNYALDHFDTDPAWLSVLSGVYNKTFAILFYRNLCVNTINRILFHIAPLKECESFLLIKHMLPYINENPHWHTLFTYIINKKDIFYRASSTNNALMLKGLIDFGFNVNAAFSRYENKSALHATQDPETVAVLLSANANPNALDDNGKSALHYAVTNNYKGMQATKQLLAAGADPNLLDKNGMPPIYYATPEIFAYLLEANIDPNLIDGQGYTLLHRLVRGDFGGDISHIKKLLELGANTAAIDDKGQTPLFHAYKEDVVKCLLASGANPNAIDHEGQTPLFVVYKEEIVKSLLQGGANPNFKNANNQTPIFEFKELGAYKSLIEAGADLTLEDLQGNTALTKIKEYQDKYKAEWLLEIENMILAAQSCFTMRFR